MRRNYEDTLYLAASSAPNDSIILIAHRLKISRFLYLAHNTETNPLHLPQYSKKRSTPPPFICIPKSKTPKNSIRIYGNEFTLSRHVNPRVFEIHWDTYRLSKTKNSGKTTFGGIALIYSGTKWRPMFIKKLKSLPKNRFTKPHQTKTKNNRNSAFAHSAWGGYGRSSYINFISIPMGGQNEYRLGGTHHY